MNRESLFNSQHSIEKDTYYSYSIAHKAADAPEVTHVNYLGHETECFLLVVKAPKMVNSFSPPRIIGAYLNNISAYFHQIGIL